MEVQILVEQVAGNGFRASSGGPLNLQVEAATRDDAIDGLRQLIKNRLDAGAEFTRVEVGADHPLAPFAGIFKNDPLLPAWKEAMKDYRDAEGPKESP